MSLSELIVALGRGSRAAPAQDRHVLDAHSHAVREAIMTGDLRVSRTEASDELGWAPRVPIFHDGLATYVHHDAQVRR